MFDRRQTAALRTVDAHGCTALHYCATNRRTLVTDLLVGHWRTAWGSVCGLLEMRDSDGMTALMHAVIANNHTLTEHLLALGDDVSCHDDQRRTVMHFAAGLQPTGAAERKK